MLLMWLDKYILTYSLVTQYLLKCTIQATVISLQLFAYLYIKFWKESFMTIEPIIYGLYILGAFSITISAYFTFIAPSNGDSNIL